MALAATVAGVLGGLYLATGHVGWAVAFVCAPFAMAGIEAVWHLRGEHAPPTVTDTPPVARTGKTEATEAHPSHWTHRNRAPKSLADQADDLVSELWEQQKVAQQLSVKLDKRLDEILRPSARTIRQELEKLSPRELAEEADMWLKHMLRRDPSGATTPQTRDLRAEVDALVGAKDVDLDASIRERLTTFVLWQRARHRGMSAAEVEKLFRGS